jgi:hypothetical protein
MKLRSDFVSNSSSSSFNLKPGEVNLKPGEDDMIFKMASSEVDRVRMWKFLTKGEIMDSISKWKFKGNVIRIIDILCPDGSPEYKKTTVYGVPNQIDLIASRLMELSMTHGILQLGESLCGNNAIWFSATEHYTTNIDADVVEGIIVRLKLGAYYV